MKRIVLCLFLLVVMMSCKKQTHDPVLSEIQYKIVNNGDSLVSSFTIWSETYLGGDINKTVPFAQAFNGIKPFDTVTVRIPRINSENNFIGAVRTFGLRVALKQKVFSQFHFDNNFLQTGEPYLYGWTNMFLFNQNPLDTIKSVSDKVFYINWPADSSKLNMVMDF